MVRNIGAMKNSSGCVRTTAAVLFGFRQLKSHRAISTLSVGVLVIRLQAERDGTLSSRMVSASDRAGAFPVAAQFDARQFTVRLSQLNRSTALNSSNFPADFGGKPTEGLKFFENEIHHSFFLGRFRTFEGFPPTTDLLMVGFDDVGDGRIGQVSTCREG
jgi:hypothetical protein